MPWHNQPFNYYGTSPTQVRDDLNRANENFQQLAQAFVNNDPTTGLLNLNWMPDVAIGNYSEYIVGTSRPTNPTEGMLFYNTNTNVLEKFSRGVWFQVPWQDLVKTSPEWIADRLRVNSSTGRLEISPDGTNWYVCYPLVGARSFRVLTVDNTNFSFRYFLLPGTSALVKAVNHAPFTFIWGNIYRCVLEWQVSSESSDALLWIGNVSSTSYHADLWRDDGASSSGAFSYTGHRVGWLNRGRRSFSDFVIQNSTNIESVGSYKVYNWTYGYAGFSNHSAYSSLIWWLGTFRTNTSGTPLSTVQTLIVFKEA